MVVFQTSGNLVRRTGKGYPLGLHGTESVNHGRKLCRFNWTIHDDRELRIYDSSCLVITKRVPLRKRKNEPDFVGSNGITADEAASAEGSEANSPPDDLLPLMSGFCSQTRHPDDLAGPEVLEKACGRSRRPARGRSPRQRPVVEHLDGAAVRRQCPLRGRPQGWLGAP